MSVQPTPRPPTRSHRVLAAVALGLMLLLGFAGFFGFGLSQPLWRDDVSRDPVAFILQVFVSAFVMITAFLGYLVLWSKRHRESVRRWDIDSVDDIPDLRELNADELRANLSEHEYLGLFVDGGGAEHLAVTLLEPERFRMSVTESARIHGSQLIHAVSVLWADDSWSTLSAGRIVPLFRAYKIDLPRELELLEGHRVLNSRETMKILDMTLTRLSGLDTTTMTSPQSTDAHLKILRLISSAPNSPTMPTTDTVVFAIEHALEAERQRRSRHRRRQVGVMSAHVRELLELLRDRRPYFEYAADPETGTWTSEFTYRTDLTVPKRPPKFDWWRGLKDRCRVALRQLPRVVYISLERAMYAANYRLKLECDEDLFFEEIRVWSGKNHSWLPRMRRSENFGRFLGWERPKGKAFTSLTAVNLSSAKDDRLKDLFLVVRMREKPPGSLAAATSLTLATLVAVWLVGLVSASHPEGVDFVAFVLALPAVAAAALGLRSARANHGLRSITAALTSTVSFFVSLLAIVLFLAESQDKPKKLLPWDWHDSYMFYLNDGYWAVLFLVESAALAVVLGTLIMRVLRYSTLASVERRPYPAA